MAIERKKVDAVLDEFRRGIRACEAYLLVCNEAVEPELLKVLKGVDVPLDACIAELEPKGATVVPKVPAKV